MDPKQLGRQIRRAREKLHLSQEELAAAIGKDQRSISEYESGGRRLAVTDLPLLADILQVPLLYFFEDEDLAKDLEGSLLEYFRRLQTRDVQEVAVKIVRVLGEMPNTK